MHQSTLNKAFGIGLALLACWLIAGTFLSGKTNATTPTTATKATTEATGVQSEKIPFALRDMEAAGGWDKMTRRQREWAWAKYRHDLIAIRKAVNDLLLHRMATDPDFKLKPQYAEMNSALELLSQAISEVEHGGPDQDPTPHHILIEQCIAAINKR
jgi:hypothetical protein